MKSAQRRGVEKTLSRGAGRPDVLRIRDENFQQERSWKTAQQGRKNTGGVLQILFWQDGQQDDAQKGTVSGGHVRVKRKKEGNVRSDTSLYQNVLNCWFSDTGGPERGEMGA